MVVINGDNDDDSEDVDDDQEVFPFIVHGVAYPVTDSALYEAIRSRMHNSPD